MSEDVSMTTSDRQAIRDTLQRGYGDATQTVLDDRVAGSIITTMRERGWASLAEVAAIIHAAGGQVRLNDEALRHVYNDDLEVIRYEDFASGVTVFRTRLSGAGGRVDP